LFNVLFIVESYYHNAQPNGICTKKVVDELKNDSDINVTVITSKTVSNQPDHERIDGVDVFSFNRNLGSILLNAAVGKKGVMKDIFTIAGKIVHKVLNYICTFVWPLHSPLLVYKYYRMACRLHKKNPFNAVVGVYCLMEEVEAARLLKKKYPDIQFSIYSLDAFSGRRIPAILGSHDIAKKSILRWEKKVFSSADNVCIMASHQQHYDDSNYDYMRAKIKVMDIPLLNINNYYETDREVPDQVKKIVFTGSARKFAGNPEYFLKLLKSIKNVEFHIYGIVDGYVGETIKESGLLNTKVFLHGMIPHEQVGMVQNEADFLINFGCENPYMIPSKIFEYISARKPIISFYRIQNDSSNPYLKNYPNRILLFEDEGCIDQNRQALDQFLKTKEFPLIEKKDIVRTYWGNTVYPMAELIKGERQLFEQEVDVY
jgi:glycosyltransferase involved in cell wall biosynthesis